MNPRHRTQLVYQWSRSPNGFWALEIREKFVEPEDYATNANDQSGKYRMLILNQWEHDEEVEQEQKQEQREAA